MCTALIRMIRDPKTIGLEKRTVERESFSVVVSLYCPQSMKVMDHRGLRGSGNHDHGLAVGQRKGWVFDHLGGK